MPRPSPARTLAVTVLLAWVGLCLAAAAGRAAAADTSAKPAPETEAVLDLQEAETLDETAPHRIWVLNDGLAHIHIKPSKGHTASTIDLYLDEFKADGRPDTVVGFNAQEPMSAPQIAARQSFPVTLQGTDVTLNAAALEPGVDYAGHLTAAVGGQSIRWNIVLTRALVVPPFACASKPETLDLDGTLTLSLKQVMPLAAAPVRLRLSSFASKDHQIGAIGFADPSQANTRVLELTDKALVDGALSIPLRTEGLTEGEEYAGTISFFAGAAALGSCPLTLQMPKLTHADLDTDVKTLSRSVSQTWTFHDPEDMAVSFHLFEKLGQQSVGGVTARLGGPADSPQGSFEVGHYVTFLIDEQPAPHLLDTGTPGQAVASIPKGGKMTVKLLFHDLPHGKYTFSLQFSGDNTTIPGPKVDVTVLVRHSWIWATLAIFVSVCISFFISSGVRNWRARKAVHDRLNKLADQQFEPYGTLPFVVFLRSIMQQTTAVLDQGWWRISAPPASVDDYLDRAERVSTIMIRFTALQKQLADADVTDSIKYHFREEIKAVMHRITAEPLDQTLTNSIIDALAKISAFMSPTPEAWYWAKLSAKVKLELADANSLQWNDDATVKKVVDDLKSMLVNLPATYDAQKAPKIDQAYWMLNLLVHRRKNRGDIVALCKEYDDSHKNFQRTCVVADDRMCQRIIKANDGKGIRIEPVDGAEPSQRLRPFTLELTFNDDEIAASYMVTNLLMYRWTFTLTGNFGAPAKTWTVTVKAPRVTEFAPYRGTLQVSVMLIRPDAPWSGAQPHAHAPQALHSPELHVEHEAGYEIVDNDELSWSRQIDKRERFVFLFVVFVATITAMPTLYLDKADFGSWGDYIAILVWAIGVEQTKNILQLLNPPDPDAGKAKT